MNWTYLKGTILSVLTNVRTHETIKIIKLTIISLSLKFSPAPLQSILFLCQDPQAITDLLSVTIDQFIYFFRILHKQNYTVYAPFCHASCTKHNHFEIHMKFQLSKQQQFFFFLLLSRFALYGHITRYLSICHLSWSHFFDYYK